MSLQNADESKPRKEGILEVATVLFAERGYEGTSMSDVAARVGMRKASLFYHFASKEVLYEAVLERLFSQLGAPTGAVSTAGRGSFVDRLETASDAMADTLVQRPAAARLLLREAMAWGSRDKLRTPLLALLEAGAAFIRAGQEAGVFVEGDAKQLVLTAIGAHFLPFAIGGVVEGYCGTQPFDPCWAEQRRTSLREQVKNMVVRKN